MANWNTIGELRKIFIDKYTKTQLQAELEKACSEEYELKRDYNGRQILELLQNVDDVYSESKDSNNSFASVKITFKNNILEVGNTGKPFSADAIERLCLGRASQKSLDNIGNKGTGLRSLLNDADWIEIHSGKYHIRFSENYAKSIFDDCKKNCQIIIKQLGNWKKDYNLCFPIMNCPEEIDSLDTEFDTLIRVKIKEENYNKETSISKQLELPFYKSLLFLPNINKIEIELDSVNKVYKKICKSDKIILQESSNSIHEYYVKNKEVTLFNNKKANLIIAIPLDNGYDFSNEKMYCYFPIRNFKTPVHALIHAPFQTNNSRDDIPNDDRQINKTLLEKCLIFLKDIAEHIANKKFFPIDLPIATLTPTDNYNNKVWDNDSFNLKQFYIDLISETRLLPTINNELISIKDCPKYIDLDFPKEFNGNLFSNLLIKLNKQTFQFIESMANNCNYDKSKLLYKNNLNELANKISELSKNFRTNTLVKIFLWWCDFCKLAYDSKPTLPHLLKDTKGNWISIGSKVYLPIDTGISILPSSMSWADLCIIHQDFVNELITQIQNNYRENWEAIKKSLSEKTSNKRILDKYSDTYFLISFKEQSTSDLIIEEINKQIDTKDKSIAFLNWFFENYKDKFYDDSSLNKINFNFIDRNNNIVSSRNLYFGNEYNKVLSEKIFSNTAYSAIAELSSIYCGSEEQKDDFIEFLKKCGVLEFPKIYDKNINNYEFKEYIKSKYNYQYCINCLIAKNIDDFELILQKLTTKEIIQWLKNDIALDNLMKSNEQNSYYAYSTNSKHYYINSNEYIKFIFNNTKWIEIEDVKYSPNQIIKYSKLKNNVSGYYGISENALINILNNDIVTNYKLGFLDSLGQLPDGIIKNILEILPDFDNAGEISKKLYEDIIKTKKTDIKPNFNTSNIKVFCFDGKYHINSDVRYALTKAQKNASKNISLIYIQPKRNSEIIRNWFGIEKYKSNLILDNYIETDDKKLFEEEISDIKLAFLPFIKENNNFILKLRQLKIIPCSQLKATDIENNNISFDVENYNYIKGKSSYFIKIPIDYDNFMLQQSIDFSDSIIEIFEDYVTPQFDKNLCSRLISACRENKIRIIDEQFGYNSWCSAKESLYEYKKINEIVLKFFKDNGLTDENIKSLKSIDFSSKLSNNDYLNLRNALVKIQKDIVDLNNYDLNINIDIKNNIKEIFEKHKNAQFNNFKKNLYFSLRSEKDKQKDFLNMLNKYKTYQIENIENSIEVDIENLYSNFFKSTFPNIKTTNNDVNIDDIYNKNYQLCLEEIGKTEENIKSVSDNFQYFLEKKTDINSLLYFCIPDNLNLLFKNFKSEIGIIKDNNVTDTISKNQTQTINIQLVKQTTSKASSKQIKSELSQKHYERQAESNEKNGKVAEKIAYEELKKSYPNIIWHSKNSEINADRNNAPTDATCDMWNTDSNGHITYFEIKSSINEFDMTINEYDSMKKFPNDYVVVLVDVHKRTISKHLFKELDPIKEISKYSFSYVEKK